MSNPTRAEKRERYREYLDFFNMKGAERKDDIDAAILADYAPITEERRAELEARRRYLARKSEQYTQSDAVFYKTWLSEIDAELEGDDA